MDWELIDTPNPDEDALRIWVDQGAALSALGTYTAGVTTLDQFNFNTAPTSEGLGSWVYVKKVGRDDKGRRGFVFAKPKTDEQARTPYKAYWWKHGNHPWPAVIYQLSLIKDRALGHSANTLVNGEAAVVSGPSYYLRVAELPAISEGTRFRVQEYFYPDFIKLPRYRVPQPGNIQLDVLGLQASFSDVLHPHIKIPPTQTANAVTLASSTANLGSAIAGQDFPATNFTTRRRYVLLHEQVEVEGGVHGKRVWVYPPRNQRLVIR